MKSRYSTSSIRAVLSFFWIVSVCTDLAITGCDKPSEEPTASTPSVSTHIPASSGGGSEQIDGTSNLASDSVVFGKITFDRDPHQNGAASLYLKTLSIDTGASALAVEVPYLVGQEGLQETRSTRGLECSVDG